MDKKNDPTIEAYQKLKNEIIFEKVDEVFRTQPDNYLSAIQREPFDYTKWRQGLDEDLSIEEISKKAMALKKTTEQKD
jgi:hypothetical protein